MGWHAGWAEVWQNCAIRPKRRRHRRGGFRSDEALAQDAPSLLREEVPLPDCTSEPVGPGNQQVGEFVNQRVLTGQEVCRALERVVLAAFARGLRPRPALRGKHQGYITLSTGTEQRAMQDGPSARDRRALHWLRKERKVENRPRLVGT